MGAQEDTARPPLCRGCGAALHRWQHPVLGQCWADEADKVSCPALLMAFHEPKPGEPT